MYAPQRPFRVRQPYVSLSRVTCLAGLHIIKPEHLDEMDVDDVDDTIFIAYNHQLRGGRRDGRLRALTPRPARTTSPTRVTTAREHDPAIRANRSIRTLPRLYADASRLQMKSRFRLGLVSNSRPRHQIH
jgi:hypothetical protein